MTWIFLDSDPLGLACHKESNREAGNLRVWLMGRPDSARVVVPEIVDREVRRSLLKDRSTLGVDRLDRLYRDEVVQLLPITTASMRRAASPWAEARQRHRPTAVDASIDADVILAAQAFEFVSDADEWAVLTGNVAHLSRLVGGRAESREAVVARYLQSPKGFARD